MRQGKRRFGCNWVVKWFYAGMVAAFAVGCGDDEPARVDDSSGVIRNRGTDVRPLAPLSGSVSGSRQPVFSFTPARSARVDICYDRACAHLLESLDADDGEAQPEAPLPAGTFFWRVVTQHERASATWQLVIPSRESGLTTASATVPDYNGDGLADVAVGVLGPGVGAVPIFNGAFFGPDFTPNLTLTGGDGFGRAIAAVGDLDGDGFVDLAVASGANPGSVTIYNSGAAGPTMGVTLTTGAVTTDFGATMASAGDVNGDGYGDVLVGGREVAQVFLGGPGGASSTAAFTLTGAGGDALIVQGYGDVNGDGAPDIYVGGSLYLGNGGGFTAQASFTPFSPIAGFAGDYDGDGLTDFAANQAVVPGTPTGVDLSQFLLLQAGEFVFASAGDVDNDGYVDVISSLSSIEGFPERERIYFGAPTACGTNGCRAFSALFIPGHDQMGGNLRAIIAGAGDIDGDGGDDIVVATPESQQVYVYLAGGARELPLNFANRTLTGAGRFGTSLAALFGTASTSP